MKNNITVVTGIPLIDDVVTPILLQYGVRINGSVQDIKSAQQKVYTIPCCILDDSIDSNSVRCDSPTNQKERKEAIHRALKRGAGKLILRQWISSARFWNLNNVLDVTEVRLLANSEVTGYRIAKQILDVNGRDNSVTENKGEIIPEVLYFSDDYENNCDANNQLYWALLSFVGSGSENFGHRRYHDDNFTRQMVKVRREFGFDEPHPRHGRVDENRSEAYAMKLLEYVVIPIHHFFYCHSHHDESSWSRYHDNKMISRQCSISYYDMILVYENALKAIQENVDVVSTIDRDKYLSLLMSVVAQCLKVLYENEKHINQLTATLVHCDLQPQNVIFWKRPCDVTDKSFIPEISSVLDWEEATFADPRFELLLICRKVCANKIQAYNIWEYYKLKISELDHEIDIGPIEPWLQLEGVHSIVTLTLQGLNLLGGGRNPWETKNDLRDKIERELHRLISLGMTFCQEAVLE